MSLQKIWRATVTAASVSLNTAESTTPQIDYRGYVAGNVYIPSGSSITTLTFFANYRHGTAADVYPALFDSQAVPVAVTITVAASRCYALPSFLTGAASFKMSANAAGVVQLTFKS